MSKPITISYSKVSTFKTCPQKYYLNSTYPIEISNSALPFGKAVETGVDVVIEGGKLEDAKLKFQECWKRLPASRWEGPKDVFDSETIFYYGTDYDTQLIQDDDVTQVEAWQKELLPETKLKWQDQMDMFSGALKDGTTIEGAERKFANRVMWLCCLRRGGLMIEAFVRDLLPKIEEVVSAQKSISIKNDEGDKVDGFIDYIMKLKGYDEPIVVDLKTAGKFYTGHDLNTSDQLGIYAAAEKINYIGYMVLSKTIKHDKSCDKCGHARENSRKTNCERCDEGKYTKVDSRADTQLLVRKLRDGEAQEVMDDFSDVLLAVKNGVNWKNPGSCFDYNKKCEYYDFCWAGKKAEDLPGVKKKST